MAKRSKKQRGERVPSYRLHKATGQGVVTLAGKDHYCGKHGDAASRRKYQELVASWIASGKRPLAPVKKTE